MLKLTLTLDGGSASWLCHEAEGVLGRGEYLRSGFELGVCTSGVRGFMAYDLWFMVYG